MSGLSCGGVVVLVEDDDDTRELLATVLRRRGHQVAMAQDGVEAIELPPVGVACLPKPIDLSCLFAMIERHCAVQKPVLAP